MTVVMIVEPPGLPVTMSTLPSGRSTIVGDIDDSGRLPGATAFAAPCKDAKGKFTKCPPAKAAPATRCKDAKGKFAKCGTPGATPVKGK